MQTSEGGRKGAEKGHATAWHIADELGLTPVAEDPSNLFLWKGERCVIKTAGIATDQVKIPKPLYASIAIGIVAKETGPGTYDLYRLTRADFEKARDESKGKSAPTQWTFRLNRLLAGHKPFQECRPIEYRVESYWPNEDEREFSEEYTLWVHDDKLERVNSIPVGARILFYETERDSFQRKLGAMKIFASGTLTSRLVEEPDFHKDADGTVWRQHRVVELDAWTNPVNGVPFETLRTTLGRKKGWAMQSCPYPIPPAAFRKLRDLLVAGPGVRLVNQPASPVRNAAHEPAAPPGDYDSLALRSEEELIRQRAAALVRTRPIHNVLTNAFKKFCESRWGITPKKSNFDVLLEFEGSRVLIEAKSTAIGGDGRQQIREAVGQLFDYRFEHWGERDNTALAVLLPDAPPDYIKKLLASLGIGVIWRVGDEFRFDKLITRHLPTALDREGAQPNARKA